MCWHRALHEGLISFVWKKDEQMPWWGMLLALFLDWIVTLPAGVIQATTNQVTPLNYSWHEFLLHSWHKHDCKHLLSNCFGMHNRSSDNFAATWILVHTCAIHNWIYSARITYCEPAIQNFVLCLDFIHKVLRNFKSWFPCSSWWELKLLVV